VEGVEAGDCANGPGEYACGDETKGLYDDAMPVCMYFEFQRQQLHVDHR
jgi:hypothetical protein